MLCCNKWSFSATSKPTQVTAWCCAAPRSLAGPGAGWHRTPTFHMLKATRGIALDLLSLDLLRPIPSLLIYTISSCWLMELALRGEERKGQEKEKILTVFAAQWKSSAAFGRPLRAAQTTLLQASSELSLSHISLHPFPSTARMQSWHALSFNQQQLGNTFLSCSLTAKLAVPWKKGWPQY